MIKRQVTQVENAGDELDPYHVAVSFRPPFSFPVFPCGKIWRRKLILHPQNVFLAGGFAENQYLFNQVKRYTDGVGIQLHRADDWSVDLPEH